MKTKMPFPGYLAAAVGITILFGAFTSLYTVSQTQLALVLQFGEPRAVVQTPGLHAKLPWQSVVFFDKRVLNLDLPTQEVIAQDKKRIVVDAYARWRITDPLRFYQSLATLPQARARLSAILSSNVRRVLGSQNFATVLSDARAKLMLSIRDGVNAETGSFGIAIVDVRIRRADLPEQNSLAIYERMQKERLREANEFRAQGEQISQEIRSKADRDVTVLLAEARRQGEITRGEGDSERNRIFAEAFGKDADFFAFYRSMKAYEESMKENNTTFILSPDSDFFRYLERGPGGR